MTYDSRVHHRRTIRLSGRDYSADGAYFVTLCTDERANLFGDVIDSEMRLSAVGDVVADTWQWLSSRYSYVVLDEWCVMPNHLHGVLVLTGRVSDGRGGSRTAPAGDVATPRRKTVGRLIGAFKTVSTKQINLQRHTPGAVVWQRNYWERVIRDDAEMDRIRRYIRDNPANWVTDDLNCRGGSRTAPTGDH